MSPPAWRQHARSAHSLILRHHTEFCAAPLSAQGHHRLTQIISPTGADQQRIGASWRGSATPLSADAFSDLTHPVGERDQGGEVSPGNGMRLLQAASDTVEKILNPLTHHALLRWFLIGLFQRYMPS